MVDPLQGRGDDKYYVILQSAFGNYTYGMTL